MTKMNRNSNGGINGGAESEHIRRHHIHDVADHQCSSVLKKHIRAPVHLVMILIILHIVMLLQVFIFVFFIFFLFGCDRWIGFRAVMLVSFAEMGSWNLGCGVLNVRLKGVWICGFY